MQVVPTDDPYARAAEALEAITEVAAWLDKDGRQNVLRAALRWTPGVSGDDPRWDAAEFVLAFDQAVDGLHVYPGGEDVRLRAVHAALNDFILKLDRATRVATSSDTVNSQDPEADLRSAVNWLTDLTTAWANQATFPPPEEE